MSSEVTLDPKKNILGSDYYCSSREKSPDPSPGKNEADDDEEKVKEAASEGIADVGSGGDSL